MFKRFSGLFLSCLLVLETIPLEAVQGKSEDIENEARAVEVSPESLASSNESQAKALVDGLFDGTKQPDGLNPANTPAPAQTKPDPRASIQPGKTSERTSAAEPQYLAQSIPSDYHTLNQCFGGGYCPPMQHSHPNPPQRNPPQTNTNNNSSDSGGWSAGSQDSPESHPPSDTNGFFNALDGFGIAALVASTVSLIATVILPFAGLWAAAIATGIVSLPAIALMFSSFYGPKDADAFNTIGKIIAYPVAGAFTIIGGLLAGLLKNLLLGLADLNIDSDSAWAKIFNVSKEIGRWTTLIGGTAAGFALGGMALAGTSLSSLGLGLTGVFHPVLVPVGFAVGGAMAASGAAQGITALVKYGQFKASESERDETKQKANDLYQEAARLGIPDGQIHQALAHLEPPQRPRGDLSQEQETAYNQAMTQYYQDYIQALKQLKQKELDHRERLIVFNNSIIDAIENHPITPNLTFGSALARFHQFLPQVIKNDFAADPLPESASLTNVTRRYNVEGQWVKVTLTRQAASSQWLVSGIEAIEPPFSEFKKPGTQPALTAASPDWVRAFGNQNNPALQASISQAVGQEIARQEQQRRQSLNIPAGSYPVSDGSAAMLLYNQAADRTILYQAIYRNSSQGQPSVISGQISQVQNNDSHLLELDGARSYSESSSNGQTHKRIAVPQDAFPPVVPANSQGEIVLTGWPDIYPNPTANQPNNWTMNWSYSIETNGPTPIQAIGSGEVIGVGQSQGGGYRYAIVRYPNNWVVKTGGLGTILVQKGQQVKLGNVLGTSQSGQNPYIVIYKIPQSNQTQLNQAVQNSNANPSSSNISSFLNQTINIPIVIVPTNGQAFATSFSRPLCASADIAGFKDGVTGPAQEEQRRREAAGGETQEERRKKQIKNIARDSVNDKVYEGMTVYRVYGPPGSERLYRRSWTNLDPRIAHFLVPTNPNVGPKSLYRVLAGLPNVNTGECLAIGELMNTQGLPIIKKAEKIEPWHDPVWPELVIVNSILRVKVQPGHECITMIPPF